MDAGEKVHFSDHRDENLPYFLGEWHA